MWAAGSGVDPGLGSTGKCAKHTEPCPAGLSPSGGTALSSLQWIKAQSRVHVCGWELCLKNTAMEASKWRWW